MGLDSPRAQRSARVREILNDPDQIADYFKGNKPRYTSTDRRYDATGPQSYCRGQGAGQGDHRQDRQGSRCAVVEKRGPRQLSRQETFRAQAQGRNEAYRQLMDSGKVETVKKRWQHATAKDPRHDHALLDGKEVDLNEGFVMGDNSMLQIPARSIGRAATHHRVQVFSDLRSAVSEADMSKSFTAQLSDIADLTIEGMEYVMRQSISDVLIGAQTTQIGITQGAETFVERPYSSRQNIRNWSTLLTVDGAEGADSYVVAISGMEIGDEMKFAWTAPYAHRIEAGFNRDRYPCRTYDVPGRHFVGKNAEQFSDHVKKRAQEVRR